MNKQKYNRRIFLKIMGLSTLGIMIPNHLLSFQKSTSRPNVVLIFTDDQGSIDLNCYGATDLYTPNLDALAKQGVRFTQFYVNDSVCSPSRAALLTGRYPQRAQLTHNAGAGKNGLPAHQVTIAEMLKKAGYKTAIFGKWHLGEDLELSPNAQGFDEFLGHKVGCIDNYSHFFYWHGPNRHDMWKNEEEYWEDGSYFPDMVVREACRFIEKNKNRPFFLYLPFNLPHYPLQGQKKYRKMYKNLDPPRNMYAASISTLDEKIGKVVNKINQLGLRENTIIIFLSDNGHSIEERTFGGGGNSGLFRGHKFTLWEGGIRVPCIISWPGHIPENQIRDQVAIAMDWMPTIAHYCNVKLPNCKIDGKNISNIIENANAKSPHQILYWQKNKRKDGKTQWAVLLQGKWKLVANGPSTEYKGKKIPATDYFLSNLENDPGETENLANKYPELVNRLIKLHEKWAKEVIQQ